MSRSRRKTPISGITTAESEKQDKRIANRRERHRNRQILGYSVDDTLLMHRRQAGNPWLMDKDGKAFFDSNKYPELMRK
jgi:4-aminobutyrate aminotransferase-like enzyme